MYEEVSYKLLKFVGKVWSGFRKDMLYVFV